MLIQVLGHIHDLLETLPDLLCGGLVAPVKAFPCPRESTYVDVRCQADLVYPSLQVLLFKRLVERCGKTLSLLRWLELQDNVLS